MNESAVIERLAGADRIWHLEQTALIQGLSEDDLEALSSHCRDAIFSEGSSIFTQGHPATDLYFLNRGSVRLSVKSSDGREKTIRILSGGDILGLEAVAPGEFYQLEAIAHEETWTSVLSREKFLILASQRPALSLNVIQILIKTMAAAHNDIRALCFMDIQQRLVSTLLRLSETHGRRVPNQSNMVKLKVRISHDYLARLIGSNRPYLSNIMSSFKKQGWVRYHRNRLLIDTEALQQLMNVG